MLAEIYGLPQGCSKGRGGSMHLADKSVGFMGSSAIVGNSIPVGTGLGHAAKLSRSGQISVVYLGDAAVEEGAFFESANFAATVELPVLFLCENNEFSVYSGFEGRQPINRKIHSMVSAIGMESDYVSSYALESLVAKTKNAVNSVRSSGKPFFLEVATTRYLEHCGPNDDSHLGYRDNSEVERKKSLDPIGSLEKHLESQGEDTSLILQEVEVIVGAAFKQVHAWLESSREDGDHK